jgi:tRNA CCA-adding enzyme
MGSKTAVILDEVLEKIEPTNEEISGIKAKLKEFLDDFGKNIKKKKMNAEIFVGGSFAKSTMIKKEHYDVDVFIRFDQKYRGKDISGMTRQALAGIKNVQEVHGSRDYFRARANHSCIIEIIPVLKVKNPKEAENITDLSYFHVNYINRKIKNRRLVNEIRLAKAFCHAANCYGAESYISGFSGYGLELLVYYYKTFMNFIKAMANADSGEKILIDIEKMYRNKKDILLDINAAKLLSPIILIDPTYKQRNVLSALSHETFGKFREACRRFIKNPGTEAFEAKKLDIEEIKKSAKKSKNELIILKAATGKQEGDIAGSKLVKFQRHLGGEISKCFDVKDSGFEYSGKKTAIYFFAVKRKKEIIKQGPKIKDRENAGKFRRNHKHIFSKNGRIYAREKTVQGIKDFLNKWESRNKKIIQDMSIKELRVIG